MWWEQDAVRLGHTGEILVSLRNAPRDTSASADARDGSRRPDTDEVARILEKAFSYETLEFVTDTDDQGVTTEWAVLRNATAKPSLLGARATDGGIE